MMLSFFDLHASPTPRSIFERCSPGLQAGATSPRCDMGCYPGLQSGVSSFYIPLRGSRGDET